MTSNIWFIKIGDYAPVFGKSEGIQVFCGFHRHKHRIMTIIIL